MNLQVSMLLRKLIKHTPKNRKNTFISGLSSDSNEVKKNFIFLLLKAIKLMEKTLLNLQLKKGQQLLYVLKIARLILKILLLLRPIKLELY